MLNFDDKKFSTLNVAKFLGVSLTCILLAACGGGGGNTNQTPIESTARFNIQAAFNSYYAKSATQNYTLAGTMNGVSVSGSGTLISGPLNSAMVMNQPTLAKTYTITGSILSNSTNVPVTSVSTDYYVLIGSDYIYTATKDDHYRLAASMNSFPTSGKVGDSGTWYSARSYWGESMILPYGTVEASYSIKADTATSVIFTTVESYKGTGANTIIEIKNYRVDSGNQMKLIGATTNQNMPNDIQAITFTFQ